jgi:hypothetical protein
MAVTAPVRRVPIGRLWQRRATASSLEGGGNDVPGAGFECG